MANVIELRFEATEVGELRISQLSTTIGRELDKTEQVAKSAGARISEAFKRVGGAIEGIEKRISSLQELIGAFMASRAVGGLTNFFGAIGRDIEKMDGFGRKAIGLFTGGIRSGQDELEDAADETTRILEDYMNQMSPARKGVLRSEAWGRQVVGLFAEGIGAGEPALDRRLSGISGDMRGWFDLILRDTGTFGVDFGSLIGGIFDAVFGTASPARRSVSGFVDWLLGQLGVGGGGGGSVGGLAGLVGSFLPGGPVTGGIIGGVAGLFQGIDWSGHGERGDDPDVTFPRQWQKLAEAVRSGDARRIHAALLDPHDSLVEDIFQLRDYVAPEAYSELESLAGVLGQAAWYADQGIQHFKNYMAGPEVQDALQSAIERLQATAGYAAPAPHGYQNLVQQNVVPTLEALREAAALQSFRVGGVVLGPSNPPDSVLVRATGGERFLTSGEQRAFAEAFGTFVRGESAGGSVQIGKIEIHTTTPQAWRQYVRTPAFRRDLLQIARNRRDLIDPRGVQNFSREVRRYAA